MRYFIIQNLTLPRNNIFLAFLLIGSYDLYIRDFVSPYGHTHHGTSSPPTYHTLDCLQFAVPQLDLLGCILSRLHQASYDLVSIHFFACWSIRVGVSGRYPFIPPKRLLVLCNHYLSFLTTCSISLELQGYTRTCRTFCCTIPGVASAGCYPASCPMMLGLSSCLLLT